MVRHAAIAVFVLSAAAWLAAPGVHAATQQSDELKQVKADIKVGLTQAKTNIDTALSIFADDLDILLTTLENGTGSLATVVDDLGDAVLQAVHDIEEANREACDTAASQIATHSTVTLANATLPGGGGDFDKFHTAQDALTAKAFKKMQGLLKKFQKSASSAESIPVKVNVLLLPFQSTQNISADHDSFPGSNIVANSCVSVLIGTSAGHVFVGGLANGLCKPQVQLGGVSTDLVVTNQIWRFVKKTGLTVGNTAAFGITTLNVEAVSGVYAIGIPAP